MKQSDCLRATLFNMLVAGWALIMISGCVPQPIYQSVQRTNETTGAQSTQSVSSADTTASNQTGKPIVLPIIQASAFTKENEDAMMKEIKSWIGTPYRFGKVEKGKGTDCSGFVGAVFQKTFNMNLPRQSSDMYGSGESISKNELKFGDLVFFQNTYKGSKGASHVGIYIGKDKFAHASTTVGVTISELSEDYYAKHYLGCRRVIKQ